MSGFDFAYTKEIPIGYKAPKDGYLQVVLRSPNRAVQYEHQAECVEWREGCIFITLKSDECIIKPNHSYSEVTIKAFTKGGKPHDQQDVPVGDQR